MTEQARVNLLGFSYAEMEAFCLDIGEKKFRAQQLLKWIHHHQVDDFEQMTDLGKAFRARLAEVAEIRAPIVLQENISRDGTRKWVLQVDGGGRWKPSSSLMAAVAPFVCPRKSVVRWIAVFAPPASRVSSATCPARKSSARSGWPAKPSARAAISVNTR